MVIRDLAAAGKPIDPSDPLLEVINVPNDLVRPGLEVYRAEGESMVSKDPERSIAPGDTLYVDTHELDLREGRIYVIRVIGDGVCVKRVREWRGELWLVSENPDYAPFQPDEAEVLGRVYHVVPKGRDV